MNILVADDQPQRYSHLCARLQDIGVLRKEIQFAASSSQARDAMAIKQFDLLILDVLIPLWPDGEPSTQHSLDLLVEIHEAEGLLRPHHIIGITADPVIIEKNSEAFTALTWTLIPYREVDDSWLLSIISSVEYLMKKCASPAPSYDTDIAIVCALNKPELEEVLKLPWNWSSGTRWLDDLTSVYDGTYGLESRQLKISAAAAPRMGMVATALLAAKIIYFLRPRWLVMCGICAGVQGKVCIGDVILADPAWDYQSGKRVRDKSNTSFSASPHQLSVSAVIRACAQDLQRDHSALSKMASDFGSDGTGSARLHIGPLASGSAVLADGEVVEEIRQQHRDLLGIEMEVYGIYAAAYYAAEPRPACFALKSVCDFADPDKDDKYQRYAAYTAARTLQMLVERFADRLPS